MKTFLEEICGVSKPIIGCVHLLPLPGTPNADDKGGMDRIVTRAREDARRLIEGGIDALLFVNEADVPYQTQVGPEVVAAMTACICHLRSDLTVPYGANILLDPLASIAVAHATGGKFVRGFFTNAYVGDMGIMNTRGPEAARFRKYIGATDVRLLANMNCAFGVPLAPRDPAATAHGALVHAGVDALVVSGSAARFEADVNTLAAVHDAGHGVPVLVGTGVTAENVPVMLRAADGAIVASSLKVDGRTLNPVDGARVKQFMAAVKACRAGCRS